MKVPVKKVILFTLGLMLLAPLKMIYLLNHDKYKSEVNGNIVYESIEKSKRKKRNTKFLIIGDSVCQQLFPNWTCNDTIYSLSSNQAVALVGQYILLNNFLSVNQDVEKVILIYTPLAFRKDLNQMYTFQYFLKPFYREEYKNMFSQSVTNQIKKIPFYYTCQFPPVLTSNWSPDWDDNLSPPAKGFMSPLNDEYLTKIIALCKEHSIKFLILPTPSRISKKPVIEDYSKNYTYVNYDFKDYFSRITYIPDSSFIDKDEVHLKNPQKFRDWYINVMNNF